MNGKRMFRRGVAIGCGLLSLTLASCDLSGLDNLDEDVALIIDLPHVETTISGSITNAATGEPIARAVALSIGGEDRADVVDAILLEPVTSTSVPAGTFELALKQGVRPSAASPVEFVVEARAEGFVPVTVPVRLTSPGAASFRISLVEVARAPEGVAVVQQQGGTVVGGVLTTPLSVTTGAAGGTQGTAGMLAQVGTAVAAANGVPAANGVLSATLAYHNAASVGSGAGFPGLPSNATVQQGTGTAQAAFLSAGVVNVEIRDSQGRSIERFTPGMDVRLDVPADLFSPELGRTVRAGDRIPAWSFNATAGRWVQEGEAVLGAIQPNGLYPALFRVTHLSTWNLGWAEQACQQSATINITGNTAGLPLRVVYRDTRTGATDEQFAWQFFEGDEYVNRPLSALRVEGFSASATTWIVTAFHGDEEVGETSFTGSPCNATINLPVSVDPERYVQVELTARVQCENQEPRLTYPFQYRRAGARSWISGFLSAGTAVIPGFEVGVPYEARIAYLANVGGSKVVMTEQRSFVLEEMDQAIENVIVRLIEGVYCVHATFVDTEEICAEF